MKTFISNKIFILLSVCLITSALFSQTQKIRKILVVHSSPSFTLQINGDFNEGMGQLGGTYNADFQSDQFIQGKSFGATKGFGLNAIGKLKLDNIGHWRFIFSSFYNRMTSYMFVKFKPEMGDKGHSAFNVISFGAGIENNFTPNHKLKVYLGLQPMFSIINGKANLYDPIFAPPPYYYDVNIKTGFRIGAAVTGGLEYVVSENIGLNLGFNLLDANLLLKNSNYTGDPYNINLMDGASDTPSKYSGSKNIVILNFSAGVSFYWGIGEKRYILSK